ncbi:hypothetical protein AAFN86_08935 [Roseomonas sp. CAU 1739]|uniref:hypothetical protein n=1 Tax=Roseomonas sp. CAU 1739 TaxID=3140364 RepID=UPI00325AA5C6
MAKRSDTQHIILSHASQRDDRLAVPPEWLPAGARQTLAKSLIRQGLVSDEPTSAHNAREAWQIDGQRILLRITDTGLRANGLLQTVQLKGRPTVKGTRYGGRGIWMLFPDPYGAIPGRDWFLLGHDAFFAWVKDRHGTNAKWDDSWSYSYLSRPLAAFLEPFSHRHW